MSSIGKSMDNMILYNHFFSQNTISNDLESTSQSNKKTTEQETTINKSLVLKKDLQPNGSRPALKKLPTFPNQNNLNKPEKPIVSTRPALKKLPTFPNQNNLNKPEKPNVSTRPVLKKLPSKKLNQTKKKENKKLSKSDKKINPSVIVKKQNIKTKHILQSKNKIKLPDSKYKSYDSHNYDIFVSNDGNILAMNNMCFVYRKSVNNYYNPQLSLQIYSTSTPKNYIVHTSRDEIFNIKIISNYNDLYDVLSTLSKYQMVNHPSEIILSHDLLMEDLLMEDTLSILFHIVEDRLILDFSNNEDKDEWNDVRNIITNDVVLKNNQIDLPIYNIHNWDIQFYQEGVSLLQLRFEKDNQVYFSGKWCEQIFHQDEVIGRCDVSYRSDYF